jgi:hypothetical protein
MTYDVGNPGPGLVQAQKCGGVKPVKGFPTLPSYHLHVRLYLSFSCLILFLEHETALNLMLKKQLHDMKEENETLKKNIHRLTVELSAYQAKFRPLSAEEKVSHE